jgi:hypothetical protein
MLVKSNDATRSDRVGKLCHSSGGIRLIHEHTAADHRIERATLRKGGIESTFNKADVRNAGLPRLFSGKLEHPRIAINRKHAPLASNPPRDHERHGARPAADIEHAHALPDACIVEHPLRHLIDRVRHPLVPSRKSVIASRLGVIPLNCSSAPALPR